MQSLVSCAQIKLHPNTKFRGLGKIPGVATEPVNPKLSRKPWPREILKLLSSAMKPEQPGASTR